MSSRETVTGEGGYLGMRFKETNERIGDIFLTT